MLGIARCGNDRDLASKSTCLTISHCPTDIKAEMEDDSVQTEKPSASALMLQCTCTRTHV